MRWGRTWIVLAESASAVRTEDVDHLARSAESGLSYLTGEELPDYLGVWLAPNGVLYHLFSDYPVDQHIRFGWAKKSVDI